MKLKHRRPSPAMGVALLALFVALGGTSIAATQLANNSVTTNSIRNSAVTQAKIRSQAIGNSRLALDSVSNGRIRDNAVSEKKLAAGSVATSKLAKEAVTNEKLGSNAVNTSNILDQGVRSAKIGTNAVGTEKINDGAITGSKLGTGLQPIWASVGADGTKLRSTAEVTTTSSSSTGEYAVNYSRSVASCAVVGGINDVNGGVGGNVTAYVNPANSSQVLVRTGFEAGVQNLAFTVVAYC